MSLSDHCHFERCEHEETDCRGDDLPGLSPLNKLPVALVEDLGDMVGQTLRLRGVVTEIEVKTAKNGNPYVAFEIMDRTGRVGGKQWETSTPFAAVGDVVGMVVRGDEFNGAPQVVVERVQLRDDDPNDFMPASHLTKDALVGAVDALWAEFDDHPAMQIAEYVLRGIREAYFDAPAALKMHHAYARGLAEHTLSMVCAARALAAHYRQFYGDVINEGLLVAGVLLHDSGKVLEYERQGITWATGVAGELVGHIPFIDALIADVAQRFGTPEHITLRLRHIVLSHHGRKEFGSPVEPRTMEAQIVHQVDMLDSRMAMMREAIRTTRGPVSDYVRPLGGRVVPHHTHHTQWGTPTGAPDAPTGEEE